MAGHTATIISASLECSGIVGSSSVFERGKSLPSTSFGGSRNYSVIPSLESIHCSSEQHQVIQQLRRAGTPTGQSSPWSYPQKGIDGYGCYAIQLSSSRRSSRHSNQNERHVFGALSRSLLGGCAEDGSPRNRRNRWKGCVCNAGGGSGVGSSQWMSKATPYEVLGVSADCSEEEIKSAFRARIKEYHPDVYQGLGDADAITQRLLQAYELLTGDFERMVLRTRKSFDPFEEPECVAEDVFVNEMACIGRGCPYSCVERAPDVFQFAPETGRARAYNQDSARWRGEYHVQLAVGQCPRNCIHYVTPEQRFRLEEILTSVLEGTVYSGEVAIMDGLIARANFENGRYNPPKRKAKKTEKWVDWY